MNYEIRDDECDLDYVANKSRITRINNVLMNNYGPVEVTHHYLIQMELKELVYEQQ